MVVGGENLGMTSQLFDTEQFSPQRRLARVWARARQVGHPLLKAQGQPLHVVLMFSHNSSDYLAAGIQPAAFLPASSSGTGRAGKLLFRRPLIGRNPYSSRFGNDLSPHSTLYYWPLIWGVSPSTQEAPVIIAANSTGTVNRLILAVRLALSSEAGSGQLYGASPFTTFTATS